MGSSKHDQRLGQSLCVDPCLHPRGKGCRRLRVGAQLRRYRLDMKRSIGGGAHRGPVDARRQRRTIRFVQALLVLTAAALLAFAGYSWGRVNGFDSGRRADALEAPRRPSPVQTGVLGILGAGALGAAVAIGGRGAVRVPSPARIEELTGRAEAAAVKRAEQGAEPTSP